MNNTNIRAVVALVRNRENKVLLIRSLKPGRGWELPGGGVEEGESLLDAIRREVREEAGLELIDLEALGELGGIPREGITAPRSQMLFVGIAQGEPKAGSDAGRAQWWTAKEVLFAGELSPLASRVALLAWAEGASVSR